MTDDELEQRLHRYQPVGPSVEARGRLIDRASAAPRPQRGFVWAAAAAALIAAGLLWWRTDATYARLAKGVSEVGPTRETEIQLMTLAWGGTEAARKSAVHVV